MQVHMCSMPIHTVQPNAMLSTCRDALGIDSGMGHSDCHWTCEQVLNLLLECCEAEEECAHVVSECLGHLALLSPEAVLPSLQV